MTLGFALCSGIWTARCSTRPSITGSHGARRWRPRAAIFPRTTSSGRSGSATTRSCAASSERTSRWRTSSGSAIPRRRATARWCASAACGSCRGSSAGCAGCVPKGGARRSPRRRRGSTSTRSLRRLASPGSSRRSRRPRTSRAASPIRRCSWWPPSGWASRPRAASWSRTRRPASRAPGAAACARSACAPRTGI